MADVQVGPLPQRCQILAPGYQRLRTVTASGRGLIRGPLYNLARLGNVLARSRHGMASRQERRDTQEREKNEIAHRSPATYSRATLAKASVRE